MIPTTPFGKICFRSKWPRRSARKESERPKFNLHKLKSEETKTQYETKFEQLLNEQTSYDDINQAVRQTTEAISNAGTEALGKMKCTRRNNRFDEDCSMAVEKKKQIRLQTLQAKKVISKK